MMDDRLSRDEERAINQEQHEATMAYARERRERIYRLHLEGLTPKEIARRVGGLAPLRVRKIIASAKLTRSA